MIKNHHFNVEIAKAFGIHAAVILDQFIYWIEKNEIENVNMHNGKTWCMASYETLIKIFPYFTKRQIEYGIGKLVGKGVLITDNFSKNRFNRTRYFTFSDNFLSVVKSKDFSVVCEMDFTKLGNEISQNCEMDNTKLGNQISQNCEMLNTTYSTTECTTTECTNDTPFGVCVSQESENFSLIAKQPKKRKKLITEKDLIALGVDEQVAEDFITLRQAKKAPLTQTALNVLINQANLAGLTLETVLSECVARNWQGFKAHWIIKEKNEVMRSMTDEQREEQYKQACEYSHKLITGLIEKGTIEDKDYHKWGFVFTDKFKECYSIKESHQHLMDAIQSEQTLQQIAIGA